MECAVCFLSQRLGIVMPALGRFKVRLGKTCCIFGVVLLVLVLYRRQNSGQVKAKQEQEPMVLSLSYWEQIANALKNLNDLQCWARTVNISMVVEPAVLAASWGLDHSKESLKFRDLFDIHNWNNMSARQNFSSLVSLEYFLENAAKKVIFVHINYADSTGSCLEADIETKWHDNLAKNGFSVVKSVCIDFVREPITSEDAFRDSIFQGVSQNVTILFNDWRGFRDDYRVAIRGARCIGSLGNVVGVWFSNYPPPAITFTPYKSKSVLVPSRKIRQSVDQFVSKYLSGEEYVAVMLRTEKIRMSYLSEALENNSCARGFLSDWKTVVNSKNITKTLFFSDIGEQHGRIGWENSAAKKFSGHIHDAIHLYISLDGMNSILEGMMNPIHSVQIALLHQQLVARATCVVMMGGGSFQFQTLNGYAHWNRGHECYMYRDGDCVPNFIKLIHGGKQQTSEK